MASLAAAPDGSTVAVAARDGRLLLVDVASGAVTELAAVGQRRGHRPGLVAGLGLAGLVAARTPQPLRRLRLARRRRRARPVTDVTDGRFTDTEPVFTLDGKYLAFLSRRSFDPVYDAHFFDLSFPFGCRPYLVPLAAATPSPFGPQPAAGSAPDDEADDGASDGDWTPTARIAASAAGVARGRRWPSTRRAWPAGSSRCRCPSPGTPRCARSRAGWPGCASR